VSDRSESDPFSDWPDRTTLTDEHGRLVLTYSASESVTGAIPWADGAWVPPNTPTKHAAAVALEAMAGWRFSTTDPALAHAMAIAGATERRHAHTMSTSPLRPVSPPVETTSGLRVESLTAAQVDRHALALGDLNLRAYPSGHPDSFDGDSAAAASQIRAIARGEMLGLMLPESRIALAEGAIVGACLVVDRPGRPPHAGPWIIDIFRDPDTPLRGVGTALLTATVEAGADSGLPGLSLAVSHANLRARRLYQRLGFSEADESWTFDLPT
jgi:ribosomal protein S18 acetylase RimI-like enzyme